MSLSTDAALAQIIQDFSQTIRLRSANFTWRWLSADIHLQQAKDSGQTHITLHFLKTPPLPPLPAYEAQLLAYGNVTAETRSRTAKLTDLTES